MAYKKLVQLLVAPYLRNVFEQEHQLVTSWILALDQRIAVGMRNVETRLDAAEARLQAAEAQDTELIKRMDSITVLLARRQEELDQRQQDLDQRQQDLDQRQQDLDRKQQDLLHRYEVIRNRAETLRYRFEDQIRSVRRAGDLQPERPGVDFPDGSEPGVPLDALFDDADYLEFEDKFRGSREEIKSRQRVYLPLFADLPPTDYVLDLGCGRGEFLELLREANLAGKGVDANVVMVAQCRKLGLDVERDDALGYLGRLADGLVGGIVALQVVEHLSTRDLLALVRLCHQKLKPNGHLVIETVNPTCLGVFSGAFYVDPGHTRPVHPEFLRFVLSRLFEVVDTWYLTESEVKLSLLAALPDKNTEILNENFSRLNAFLYGAGDYAVIARKVD
ncbi:MAG: class I SAM-dependent methyltransferase [Candidatus Rokubacteria bacterium]|nr:class I SAM-dependent methyltransferase [Candidatus Rokubacteria bacterium]